MFHVEQYRVYLIFNVFNIVFNDSIIEKMLKTLFYAETDKRENLIHTIFKPEHFVLVFGFVLRGCDSFI